MAKVAKNAVVPHGEAILFISRLNARTIVREEFKATGITTFHIPENAQRCLGYLEQHPEAYLVMDWEVGDEQATKVLEGLSGKTAVSLRPVLLIAMDLSPQVIGTAAEYQVSRVHTGELTRAKFAEHVESLLKEKKDNAILKEGLNQVSQARVADDWHESLKVLQNMIERFPDNLRLNAEYIENLMHVDRWDDAIGAAKIMSENEPGYARGLNLYGRCLMKQKRFGDACEVFRRAKLLNPYNVGRLVFLGQALLEIDKVSEARENFESALKLQRGRKDAIVGLGECMLMEGDVNDALKLLKEVSGHRELASIFNTAAILSMRQGRFEIGKTLYHVAMRSVGADKYLMSRLIFNLGIGYYRWQRPFDALECFEKALESDASYADAKTNAVVLAKRLGSQAKVDGVAAVVKPVEEVATSQFKGEFNEDGFSEESIISEQTSRPKAG